MQRYLDKTLNIFIFFLIFAYPFLPIVVMQWTIVAANIIYAWIYIRYINKDSKRSYLCLTIFFLLGFILWYLAESIVAQTFFSWNSVAFTTVNIMIFVFPTMYCIDSRDKENTAFRLMLVASLFVVIMGFYQWIFGTASQLNWIDKEIFDVGDRIYSFFSNPNFYGIYLVAMFSVVVELIWNSKEIKQKLAYGTMIALILLSIILTYSRAGFGLIILSIAIFFEFVVPRKKLFAIYGVAIAILLIVLFIMPDNIAYRYTSFMSKIDSTIEYRLEIYKSNINMLEDYWISGVGVGRFSELFHYYTASTKTGQAHNLFFQIFIELGIIGFILFIGFILSFFNDILVTMRECKKYNYWSTAVFISVVCFLAFGMVEYTWLIYKVKFLFWIMIGIGINKAKQVNIASQLERLDG